MRLARICFVGSNLSFLWFTCVDVETLSVLLIMFTENHELFASLFEDGDHTLESSGREPVGVGAQSCVDHAGESEFQNGRHPASARGRFRIESCEPNEMYDTYRQCNFLIM